MIDKRGWYDKFYVRRRDGSNDQGGKHDGCEYFVLDLTHDPCAIPALKAYVEACKTTRPKLAADLRAQIYAMEHAGEKP